MIDHSNYSCDKCTRVFSRYCKHCLHTAEKPPTRFKKKKKTGIETPEFRKPTSPPPPPTSGSNAVKPSRLCTYSTPCGWCCKWDKKCDNKIGCGHGDPVGKNGAIGVCPDCGSSGYISWNPVTDVSSCSCGWNNEKPQRGLRVKIKPIGDAIDYSYGKCLGCKYEVGCDKECNPENNFKYFQSKEPSNETSNT